MLHRVYERINIYCDRWGVWNKIEDSQVIATTSDGKYTYTFEIIDDNIVSFVADKSDTVQTVEGITAVPDGAEFKLIN